MSMNDREFFKMIEALKSTLKCRLCGKPYNLEEINFLGSFNSAHLLEMHCSECNLTVMASVLFNQEKPKIDLLKNEVRKFNEASDVTSDELIELHKFLKSFKGDFKSLFESPPTDNAR